MNVEEVKSRTVVRLTSSAWEGDRGVHIKKSLIFLKSKCTGYNVLSDECDAVGALAIFKKIKNLDLCKDGYYEVVACNFSRDWESGQIDDWDLKLIPYSKG